MCYSGLCNYPIINEVIIVNQIRHQLRLNVGFIIGQAIGYSREFSIDIPLFPLNQEITLEEFSGVAKVGRTQQGLVLHGKFRCTMKVECVRCLNDTVVPLETDFNELYAFTTKSMSESGLILPEDGQIDLEPLLREYLTLEVPIRPLCKPDCKGLCVECGENLNDRICEHQTKQPGI